MTEEEVKALIQELRDEIPAIHEKLHEEWQKEAEKQFKQHLKDNE